VVFEFLPQLGDSGCDAVDVKVGGHDCDNLI
jgi:hypothetical protein